MAKGVDRDRSDVDYVTVKRCEASVDLHHSANTSNRLER